jgi:hypothetical protein
MPIMIWHHTESEPVEKTDAIAVIRLDSGYYLLRFARERHNTAQGMKQD